MDEKQKTYLAVGGGVIVVILLLLLLRHRANGGASNIVVEEYAFELPGIVLNVPPGTTYNLSISPPTYQTASGCDCGCDNSVADAAYTALINGFASSLSSLQADYTDQILDAMPDFLWQHWNNGAAQQSSALGRAQMVQQ